MRISRYRQTNNFWFLYGKYYINDLELSQSARGGAFTNVSDLLMNIYYYLIDTNKLWNHSDCV